jgi:predicted secreted protein
MFKYLVFIASLLVHRISYGSEHQIIDTLGSSPKGQFVALEEYGYKSHNHSYYVTIKVMNMWKKEFVGQPIKVELKAHRPIYLQKAREKARVLAKEELTRFDISG